MKQNTPQPPIRAPKKIDPQWPEKVERANKAREMSRMMRLGKPTSFRSAVGRAG